jgi:hypothetical protein
MKADKRNIWTHTGCEVVPVSCYHPTWGKAATEIDFGHGPRSRYWKINFPDGTHIHVETKADARRYIDDVAKNKPHHMIQK